AGDKVTTLQTLDPIYIDFYLPQQDLAKLKVGQAVTVTNDAYPGQTFTGKVTTIDPLVDTTTRNVQVEATIANKDLKLIPGMFAAVNVTVGQPEPFLTAPKTAITFNPYGETVFIVKE